MSRAPFIGPTGWGAFPTVLGGSLTVLANGINVTGNSTISGTLGGLTGLTIVSGGISVTGNSTISGTLGGLTGFTVVSGGFTVTGNSTLTGTLTGLTGVTIASGGLTVTAGGATIGGSLAVTPTAGVGATFNAVANSAAIVSNGSAYTPSNNIGNSGTTFTVDCSKSNVHYVTMTGNVGAAGLTISNLQEGQTINLECLQDGTGGRTIAANAFSITLVWAGGIPSPLLSTGIGAKDLITISKINGTNFASIGKGFV
jgi:hypothetical protein